MQALLKKAFMSTSASEYALGDLKRNDINAVFPYSMTKVNPGQEEVEDAEVLGERIVLEPESKVCREVLTLQVHPEMQVFDRQMMRMCPVFAQPRETVREQYNPNRHTDEGNGSDGEGAPAGDVLDDVMMNFNFDWPYNFGSIADIDNYRPARMRKIRDRVLEMSPEYRIYVQLLQIDPEVEETSDDIQILEDEDFQIKTDSDNEEQIIFTVSPKNDDILYCNKKIAFVDDAPAVAIADYVDSEHVNGGRNTKYTVAFSDKGKMPQIGDIKTIYAVKNAELEDADIEALINKAGDVGSCCALGAKLMGFASRNENVLISDFKGIVTLSCLMAGTMTILVHADFIFDDWCPGDGMFMALNQDDIKRGYIITYKHREELEDDDIYAFIGVYVKPSGHSYYKCCDISAIPCISEQFTIKEPD